MRELLSQPPLRRGLLVALDGLAVWLLAVVLASYVDPGSVAGDSGGLLPTAVETTRLWAETSGIGAFELLAYAGLAVTAVGSLWYLVVRPAAARLGRDRSTGDRDRDGDGFRYDRPSTAGRRRAGPAGRDRRPMDGPGSSLPGRGEPDGLRRIAHLFDPEPPPGGFLRGSGGSDDEARPKPATAGGAVDGADAPASDDDGPPTTATVGPTLDGLGSALAASRARLEPVSDRLAAAADGDDVEAAGANLASTVRAADGTLEALPTADPDDLQTVRRRLAEARAEQRRLESAFDRVLDGE